MADEAKLQAMVHTTLTIGHADYPIESFELYTPWNRDESEATMQVRVSRETFLAIVRDNPFSLNSLVANRQYVDSPRTLDMTVTVLPDVTVTYPAPQEAQFKCYECHIPLYNDELPDYRLLGIWRDTTVNNSYSPIYICKPCLEAWQARQEPTFDTHTIANES